MDIVERLRKESYWALSKEAADEIERLRKENQKLALDLIAVLGQWHDNDEQNAALKEGE